MRSTETPSGPAEAEGEARPAEPVVVLLPDAGMRAHEEFSFLLTVLGRRRRAIALDVEPIERAEEAVDAFARLVRATRGAIDAIAPAAPVALVGHGLGAAVATAIAADEGRVVALVLVAGWLAPSERTRVLARAWTTLHEEGSAALADLDALLLLGAPHLEERGREGLSRTLDVRARDGIAMLGCVDLRAAADRVRAPALVVGCARDAIVPEAESRALFAAIADSRYARVDSGHAVLAERPAELGRLVEEFVRCPEGRRAGAVLEGMRP